MIVYDFIWYITYTSISAIYKKIFINYLQFKKKIMETRILKNNFIKMEELGTSKLREQGWEVNVGLKITQTTSI